MQKAKETKKYGTTVAGIVIVALAFAIIFVTIAVPHMRENKILNERLEVLLFAEYERMVVSDPLFKTGGTLVDRGAEVMLTEVEITALREKLATVVAAGFRNVENEARDEGAWDLKWQVRTAEEERTDLYFADSLIYFYADGMAFCFEPKDLTAYDALYALLQSTLTT